MGKFIDLTGQRFGRLVVVEYAGSSKHGTAKWNCVCDCGASKVIMPQALKAGLTKSCGCIKKEQSQAIIGKRFGRLIVIGPSKSIHTHNSLWECQCDCGKVSIVHRSSLTQNQTRSCGCLRDEMVSQVSGKYNKTHGESISGKKGRSTREYSKWHSMKDRCLNKNHPSYKDYGGRGITVCDRWMSSFQNFLADMGRCPNECSIERIDNDKGYSPDNCKWGTHEEQNNNKRNSFLVSYDGETLTVAQWARRLGMKKITLWQRLTCSGWSPEKAFTTPVYKNGRGGIISENNHIK